MKSKSLLLVFLPVCIFSCQKELDDSVLTNPIYGATFSLVANADSCSITSLGTYQIKSHLDTTNKIAIEINATSLGTWQASTNIVDGFSFSGKGKIKTLGTQNLILQGVGVPLAAGKFSFVLSTANNACKFAIFVDTSLSASNAPPVAFAGADTSIQLPINSFTLLGSGTDRDGTIASYFWTKVSGPTAFTISDANVKQPSINNLVEGTYQFELRVVDNLGAVGKDTISLTVKNATISGTLSKQQNLYSGSTVLNVFMEYNALGKLNYIRSNYYQERKIFYKNNKISSIEYWYNAGDGTVYKGETHNFTYDANGNVVKIDETDEASNKRYIFADFTYSADNKLKTKRNYFPSSGGIKVNQEYIYTNDNLTGLINYNPINNSADTTNVSYDNRTNTFPAINEQNYFLDIQTDLDRTYRSEIFYFSKNYPTNFGTLPISVSVDAATQKPFEISFGKDLWYRYLYN